MNLHLFRQERERTTPEPSGMYLSPADVDRIHGLLGMLTELGELADIVKRNLFYGKPLDRTHIIEERGDMEWYADLFDNAFSIQPYEAHEGNVRKLRARYPDGFSAGRALNRDVAAERAALAGTGTGNLDSVGLG